VPFDLGNIEQIPDLVRKLRKDVGPLEELVRVNTLSPLVLTKYVARAMMADGAGRIVNVASIVGFTGYSGLSVYAATKAAMLGFTRSLAREVGRLDITVNAVAPGFLDTEMTHGLAEEQRRKVVGRSALRRLAGVDDVAERRRAQYFRHGFDHRCRRYGVGRRWQGTWGVQRQRSHCAGPATTSYGGARYDENRCTIFRQRSFLFPIKGSGRSVRYESRNGDASPPLGPEFWRL
jgi:short subunit dehydrogenase